MKLFVFVVCLALTQAASLQRRDEGEVLDSEDGEVGVFRGLIDDLKEKVERLKNLTPEELKEKLNELRKDYIVAWGAVALQLELMKEEAKKEFERAKEDAIELKNKLSDMLKGAVETGKDRLDEFLEGHSDEFKDVIGNLKSALKTGAAELKKFGETVKSWITGILSELGIGFQKRALKGKHEMTKEERKKWDSIIEELERALKEKFGKKQKRGLKGKHEMTKEEIKKWDSIIEELERVLKEKFGKKQKRALKGFKEMTAEERKAWNAIIAEMKKVLKDKFGIQDPDQGRRISPEVREKFEAVKKELLKKIGQTGHIDETDDEWKEKWGKVIKELEESLKKKQKRALKGFKEMTAEERKAWNAIIKELMDVLKDKFGKQDPDQGRRISPEVREKFEAVKKELLKKIGQTGHIDETDDEWKEKWGKVIKELEESLKKKQQ